MSVSLSHESKVFLDLIKYLTIHIRNVGVILAPTNTSEFRNDELTFISKKIFLASEEILQSAVLVSHYGDEKSATSRDEFVLLAKKLKKACVDCIQASFVAVDGPATEFEQSVVQLLQLLEKLLAQHKQLLQEISENESAIQIVDKGQPFLNHYFLPKLSSVVGVSSSFMIEPHMTTFVQPSKIKIYDYYREEFLPSPHYNFICLHEESQTCVGVVSVLESIIRPVPGQEYFFNPPKPHYKCLLSDKTGSSLFTISALGSASTKGKDRSPQKIITNYLNSHTTGKKFYEASSFEFIRNFLDLEIEHTRTIKTMKVAIFYAKPTDKSMDDIKKNDPPESSQFWKFMDDIATRVNMTTFPKKKYRGEFGKDGSDSTKESYYTVWQDVEIMFHVGPWLSDEQNRRLIGNDIMIIIYYDDPLMMTSFNTEPFMEMGPVAQVYVVVQPSKIENMYRLGGFNRGSMKLYDPGTPPINYLLDIYTIREYLFTKLHNGLTTAHSCPPIMRLFQIPREYFLKELGAKFPPQKEKDVDDNEDKLLIVSIFSARNLPPRENKDVRSPFCIVSLEGNSKEFRTHVAKDTLSPSWQTEFKINLNNISKTAMITISVYDWMGSRPDELIGNFGLPMVACATVKSATYPLIPTQKDISAAGEIEVGFLDKKGVFTKEKT